LLAIIALCHSPASAGTLTTTSIADTTIFGGFTTTNRGKEPTIFQGNLSGSTSSLAQFSLAGIPAGQVINSATLQFEIVDYGNYFTGGQSLNMHRLLVSWLEGNGTGSGSVPPQDGTSGATWLSRDKGGSLSNWATSGAKGNGTDRVAVANHNISAANVTDVPLTSVGIGFGDIVTVDVTADVQAWYSTPASNFGWLLEPNSTTPSGYVGFASNDHLTRAKPTLVVQYSAIPEPSACLLLGCGGLGLAILRTRDKRPDRR
jgi:hypothetical protein